MGPSERNSELVLFEDRARLARLVQEEIIGVENLVAQELKNGSVKVVASGSCNKTDIGAPVAAKPSIVKRGLNLKFLNAVRVWNGNAAAACGTALNVTDTDSVHLVVVVVGARAVDVNSIVGSRNLRKSNPTESQFTGVVNTDADAWRETNNLREVPRCQWQALDGSLVHDASENRIAGLEHLRAGGYL